MPSASTGSQADLLAKVHKGSRRLRTRADLERVRRDGRSWTHRLLVLLARPNELGVTRVGVAAGKRLGSAVVRNRVKRLMREAIRRHYLHIAPSWDLLLIARAAITPLKMQEVADALEALLRQAELWRESATGDDR